MKNLFIYLYKFSSPGWPQNPHIAENDMELFKKIVGTYLFGVYERFVCMYLCVS